MIDKDSLFYRQTDTTLDPEYIIPNVSNSDIASTDEALTPEKLLDVAQESSLTC